MLCDIEIKDQELEVSLFCASKALVNIRILLQQALGSKFTWINLNSVERETKLTYQHTSWQEDHLLLHWKT